MCVRRFEFIPSCRQKSVTSNFSDAPMRIKLNADVSATDTTQVRVTQHDVAAIQTIFYIQILLHLSRVARPLFSAGHYRLQYKRPACKR